MNSERQDFEQLRRLMKLKRYEQPPPRYFNDFSSTVIARIEAGEARQASGVMAWLQRFWSAVETKTAYSGLFGATAFAALIGAFIFADGVQGGPGKPEFGPTFVSEEGGSAIRPVHSVVAHTYSSLTRSNDTVIPKSLFDRQVMGSPMQANFSFSGH